MSRIKRTRSAIVDVTTIWNYIAERNFPAAEVWADRVDAKLRLLARNPELGESVDHLRQGARRVSLQNYVLYFEPIEDGVRLLRVVHGARDVPDLTELL
jgi:toxin ParE1/3/4